MSSTKVGSLNINVQALGEAFYRIICEAGQTDVVALGMIPAPFHAALQRLMEDRVLELVVAQHQITVREARLLADPELVKQQASEAVNAIIPAIFTAAHNSERSHV